MLSNTRTVAICGAPLVGKRQILNRIAEAADCHNISEEERCSGERIVRLQVMREELARSHKATLSSLELPVEELELRLASGHMFFKEPVIRAVLCGASMICYVAEPDETGPYKAIQEEYFQAYLDAIQEDLSPEIPWIWVLNKVDLGSTNPLEQAIPRKQLAGVIRTDAVKGTGIGLLWEKIVEGL